MRLIALFLLALVFSSMVLTISIDNMPLSNADHMISRILRSRRRRKNKKRVTYFQPPVAEVQPAPVHNQDPTSNWNPAEVGAPALNMEP